MGMFAWKIKMLRSLYCEVEPQFELLNDFLTGDLCLADFAQDLLTKLTDIEKGTLHSWHREGNAYVLDASACEVKLQFQFDREYQDGREGVVKLVMPLADFAHVVRDWTARLAEVEKLNEAE